MKKTYLAMTTLMATIAVTPACGDLQKDARLYLDSVAYRPDGTLVAFTNGAIFTFGDEHLQTVTSRIPLAGLTVLETPAQYVYSLSLDGTVAAAAYSPTSDADARVALYRLPTGERIGTFEVASTYSQPVPNRLTTIALSPHGELLAVSQPFGRPFTVVDTTTGSALWAADEDKVQPTWSRDGATVYALDWLEALTPNGTILEGHDAHSGSLKWSRSLEADIQGLAMVGDGTTLAGMANPPECGLSCEVDLPFFSATDGTTTSTVLGSPNGRPQLGFLGRPIFTCSTTDDVCAVEMVDNDGAMASILIYRPDGTVVATLHPDDYVSSMALSPDGQFLAVTNIHYSFADDIVRVFRIADGAEVGKRAFAAADLL